MNRDVVDDLFPPLVGGGNVVIEPGQPLHELDELKPDARRYEESAIRTSDGLWSSDSVWGGDPYEHWDAMMAVSPITHAENITTPLLLLHSDEDHRCPVEQAEQLFTRLRLLGREVEFVRFPHGTHDLSRGGPPRQRVFRFETILRWFARFLQEDLQHDR